MAENIFLGAQGSFKIFRSMQHTVGSCKGPQDTGAQHTAFVGQRMQHAVPIDAPIEAPMLGVLHTIEPKGQNIILQKPAG